MPQSIRLGVDVGGTFTDVALVTETGALVTAKVPSTDEQSKGVLRGLEKVCQLANISPGEIDQFTHSMTVSVNALLEETGARTALVTTEGFRDILEIGRQDRPDLYDINVERPVPLVPRRRRLEIPERAATDGIEKSVDDADIRKLADQLEDMEIESVAICFLHAYAHPENERRVAGELRTRLDAHVSVSHEVLAEFREYERTSTTVIDAYLRPELDAYLGKLERRAAQAGVPPPRVMQANGGIARLSAVRKRAVTTVMSGPAAGVVGAQATVERNRSIEEAADSQLTAGIITFDMGGTSSDVSLIRNGEIVRTTDTVVNGRPIKVPMVDVNTVGAGGGSIAWVDRGGALRVGPRSAGSNPGPACYGRGGTAPTVTDANLVLGYIGATSRLGGELVLDAAAARTAIERLSDQAELGSVVDTARGIFDIANATMTRAIRSVTVERGYDPRGYTLAAFGGAGPMHAAALAEALDIEEIIIPRACGVLSAFGLLAADEKYDAVRTIRSPLSSVTPRRLDQTLENLAGILRANAAHPANTQTTYHADLRYAGQSFELMVPLQRPVEIGRLAEAFHREHERSHGYRLEEPIELVNLRTAVVTPGETPTVEFRGGDGDPLDTRRAFFDEEFVSTPVFRWTELSPDQQLSGPTIVDHPESTVVIPPNWTATIRPDGSIILGR